VFLHDFVRLCEFAVAALFGGQIDDHATRVHRLDHRSGNQLGRGLAWNKRRCDDDVHIGSLLCEQRHLRLDELLAHDLGVTALARALFLEIQFEKFRVHAFDLFFDLRARVERADDRAHAFRRADRRKSRHARAGPLI
jgi:hypothetical protein